MTRTTDTLGTPSYMAPEQARGDNAPNESRDRCLWTGGSLLPFANRPAAFCGRNNLKLRMVLETDPRKPQILNESRSGPCDDPPEMLEKDPSEYASAERSRKTRTVAAARANPRAAQWTFHSRNEMATA